MSFLLPKEQMQSLNIDTVERAIVFGALCLEIMEQSGLNNPETEIGIEPIVDRRNTSFSISGTFSLDTAKYYKNGGLIFRNLAPEERPIITPLDITIAPLTYPFQLITLVSKWNIKPSNSLEPAIPDYPNSFRYFEQYLLYYFFVYWASIGVSYSREISLELVIEETEETELIELKKHKISFSINLPVNFETWFLGGNYINSVERVLDTYRVPDLENFRLEGLSRLTNVHRLTNLERLTN